MASLRFVYNSEDPPALKAESDVLRVEALAQRSYNVHQATFGHSGTAGNTIEDFIAALEQEQHTGGAEPSESRSAHPGSDSAEGTWGRGIEGKSKRRAAAPEHAILAP